MTWDTVVSIKQLLDGYSEATGQAYVLLVAQGNESTPRVISKAMAAMPDGCGLAVMQALEDAAADVFEEMEEHYGS